MLLELIRRKIVKGLSVVLILSMLTGVPAVAAGAQAIGGLPSPGTLLYPTGVFHPAQLVGLKLDSRDPFHFQFVIDRGDTGWTQERRKDEYGKLIRHFLAALTVANKDMWVNLSPYESDRIIEDHFGRTDTGKELLEQDYILKQFTASLMYPEEDVGRGFWRQVYRKAYEKLGTTDIPVDTFNKIWIRADQAEIYEKGGAAFLVKSHLKVMLENDFLAGETAAGKSAQAPLRQPGQEASATREFSAGAVRDIIIPIIEQEVNEGRNFSVLRQIYNAMILATWFKRSLRESLLGQVYADRNRTAGVEAEDPAAKEKVYEQYLEAFRIGVFNYIKEEEDPLMNEIVPRKYFSGGMVGVDAEILSDASQAAAAEFLARPGRDLVDTDLVSAINRAYARLSDDEDAFSDGSLVRALEQLTARAHFQSEADSVDGVSYATQRSGVENLVRFARQRPGVDRKRGQVFVLLPDGVSENNVFVRYARQRRAVVRLFSDIETLQEALNRQTAIVLVPYARSNRFDALNQRAFAQSPQALLAFTEAIESQSVAVSDINAQGAGKGLVVVAKEDLSLGLRNHRDRRGVEAIHPREARERLEVLKKTYASQESAGGAVTPVFSATSGTPDQLWKELQNEVRQFVGSATETFLGRELRATILDHETLESALEDLLANTLSNEHVSKEDIQSVIHEMLGAPEVREAVRADLHAVWKNDPAIEFKITPFSRFKGFKALQGYRVAHWLWQNGRKMDAEFVQSRISERWNIDIHPGARLGKGIVLDHGIGIVIGGTAVVGDDTYILHNVTLGSNGKKDGQRRHPVVGKGVLLGAGAVVIGPVTVGSHARIGANATVSRDVPERATVTGVNNIKGKEGTPPAAVSFVTQAGVELGTAADFVSPGISSVEEAASGSSSGSLELLFPQVEDREEAFGQYLSTLRRSGLEIGEKVERAVAFLETQWLAGNDRERRQYRGVSSPSGVSGMADVIRFLLSRGESVNPNIVLIRSAYGGTDANLDFYRQFGVDVRYVTDPDNELEGVLDSNTAGVIFESPNNPPLRVWDIRKIVDTVKSRAPQALTVFDGAFATPAGQQPLRFGVDIVVQVVTKMLGTGNVFGTVTVARKELAGKLREVRSAAMHEKDLENLFEHGLPTFYKRYKKSAENARIFVDWLKTQKDQVSLISYPGDQDHPQFSVARAQAEDGNYGNMVYFDLRSLDAARLFIQLFPFLRTAKHSVSLGEVRTQIQLPLAGAASTMPEEAKKQLPRMGMSFSGVRVSVGVEDPQDLIRDFQAAFDIVRRFEGREKAFPIDELRQILMHPTVQLDGEKKEYVTRLFPVVRKDSVSGELVVEPKIEKAIARIERNLAASWLKAGGQWTSRGKRYRQRMEDILVSLRILHEATRIDRLSARTQGVQTNILWNPLVNPYSVTPGGGESNAYVAQGPDELKLGFAGAGEAGKPVEERDEILPSGLSRVYGRIGTANALVFENVVASAEAGTRQAYHQDFQGVSAPSLETAVSILLEAWALQPPRADARGPVRITVLAAKGGDLEEIARKFERLYRPLFGLRGERRVDFRVLSVDDDGRLPTGSIDRDADLVFLDEFSASSDEQSGHIRAVKEVAAKARVAVINSDGLRRGYRPLRAGADFVVDEFTDFFGQSIAAAIVTPRQYVTRYLARRTYTSIASRAAMLDILPVHFLDIPRSSSDGAMDAPGGISLDDSYLRINIKRDAAGFPLPVPLQDAAMFDIRGLAPIIRSITPMGEALVPIGAQTTF
jgi:serine O-acetyltransferase